MPNILKQQEGAADEQWLDAPHRCPLRLLGAAAILLEVECA